MSYDSYALIHAHRIREQQIAEAADHRLASMGPRHTSRRSARRSPLRPIGQVLVRLGLALGAEPDSAPLQPVRSR